MAKPKTYDEALQELEGLKSSLAEKKEELREYKKENNIRRDKPTEDTKIAAALQKKEDAIEKLRTQIEEMKETAKGLKPAKERVTKYEYPADCVTDKDKKRYRAKMRRGEKGEGEEKPKKKDKKSEEGSEEKPKKKIAKKVEKDEEED